MADNKPETRILITSPEEMEKRRSHIKAFRNPKERKILIEDHYEKVRVICELMIMEGFSDSYIDELLSLSGDPDHVDTFDVLHAASLIMGEDFVREKLIGKVISLDETCRLIREDYHEKQMQPFREIYENLDERMRLAREGEETVNHQIEILKLQSDHAGEMYEQRMENAKTRFSYELKMEQQKNENNCRSLEERISVVTKRLEASQEKEEMLRKENERLSGRLRDMEETLEKAKKRRGCIWPFGRKWDDSKEESSCDDSCQEVTEDEAEETDLPDLAEQEMRREFCLMILGNQKFSGAQIELLLPVLEDEKIPISTLEILCRPELPAENMTGFIKYIKGGKGDEGK